MSALQSYFQPMPSFGGDEYLNRQQWGAMPKTADASVLNQTYLRSKAAHDRLMQAQAMEAEQDNQILNTATPDELANLFGTPRTPREERLQRIVQKDVNAKNFGVRLIGTPEERLKYQQSSENLRGTQLENYFNPLKFDLEKARFGETKTQNSRNYLMDQAQLANLVKNQDWQREHQQTQDTASQDRFERDFALRQGAQLRADQRFSNSDFFQMQKAVRDGEISAEDLISAVPTLTPGQQSVLRGHEASAIQAADDASKLARYFINRLNTPPPTVPARPGSWFFGLGGKPESPPTESEIAAAHDAVIRDLEKNPLARRQIILDPDSGQFRPLLRAPSRAPFVPPVDNSVYDARGATPDAPGYLNSFSPAPTPMTSAPRPQPGNQGGQLLEGPDGYLYRMVNGQPQRTNLRRRTQ